MNDGIAYRMVKIESGDVERFWRRVNRAAPNGCWQWEGRATVKGYGQFRIKGRSFRAHRIAWQLENGSPVPSGLLVCHKCDNPPCVNPAHLFVGTVQDNAVDMWKKGRGVIHRPIPKTHCHRGHDLAVHGARVGWNRGTVCRECARQRSKNYRAQQRVGA